MATNLGDATRSTRSKQSVPTHPVRPRLQQDSEIEDWDPEGLVRQPLQILPPEEIIKDFRAFGFSEEKIAELMAMPEPPTDVLAQPIPGRAGRPAKREEYQQIVYNKKNDVGRYRSRGPIDDSDNYEELEDGYRHLLIGSNKTNWVLYDPAKRWRVGDGEKPHLDGLMMPISFRPFSHYKPGNKRFLSYNLATRAVRMQWVGDKFDGLEVLYDEDTGPKLLRMSNYKGKLGSMANDLQTSTGPVTQTSRQSTKK